jgi:hypothetical protein
VWRRRAHQPSDLRGEHVGITQPPLSSSGGEIRREFHFGVGVEPALSSLASPNRASGLLLIGDHAAHGVEA